MKTLSSIYASFYKVSGQSIVLYPNTLFRIDGPRTTYYAQVIEISPSGLSYKILNESIYRVSRSQTFFPITIITQADIPLHLHESIIV